MSGRLFWSIRCNYVTRSMCLPIKTNGNWNLRLQKVYLDRANRERDRATRSGMRDRAWRALKLAFWWLVFTIHCWIWWFRWCLCGSWRMISMPTVDNDHGNRIVTNVVDVIMMNHEISLLCIQLLFFYLSILINSTINRLKNRLGSPFWNSWRTDWS